MNKEKYIVIEEERLAAIQERNKINKKILEKYLDEFRHFIGKDMRLERVTMRKEDLLKELLNFIWEKYS